MAFTDESTRIRKFSAFDNIKDSKKYIITLFKKNYFIICYFYIMCKDFDCFFHSKINSKYEVNDE